jgi:hypothetical protein
MLQLDLKQGTNYQVNHKNLKIHSTHLESRFIMFGWREMWGRGGERIGGRWPACTKF